MFFSLRKLKNIFKFKKGDQNMSKATATISGSTLSVRTGVNKSIRAGTRVYDENTDSQVVFIGQVNDPKARKHPFAFLDVESNEMRRHSADYVAKYIG